MSDLTVITGATGLIGRYVLRQGIDAGRRIRAVVRRPEALGEPIRYRIEIVRGDLRDRAVFPAALRGVHTVLHLAACARAWARDPAEFTSVNVDAVERLLEAAYAHGVERLVHVSTVLTRPPYRPAPVNGSARQLTLYEETKRAGERLVDSYVAAGGQAVVVHPTRVYGPGPETDANAVTKAIALYLNGRLRLRLADDDVVGNYVHAADVASGIWLAAQRGARGAHYILGGENAPFREVLRLVDEIAGTHRRVLALPHSLALAAAHAAEFWGRLGGRTPITPGWVRILLEDRRADVEPTRRELGYEPRPLRDGLAETIAWLTGEREEVLE